MKSEWFEKLRWGLTLGEWPWKVRLFKKGEHLTPPRPWPDPPQSIPMAAMKVTNPDGTIKETTSYVGHDLVIDGVRFKDGLQGRKRFRVGEYRKLTSESDRAKYLKDCYMDGDLSVNDVRWLMRLDPLKDTNNPFLLPNDVRKEMGL